MSAEVVVEKCPVKNISFIRYIVLKPPSDNAICAYGFMFGVMCCITNAKLEEKKKQLDLLESPLSTLFAASCYGGFTSCGAYIVSRVMPKQFTPAISVLLIASTGYLGYKLAKSYLTDNSKE
jgi:hypothetical protein